MYWFSDRGSMCNVTWEKFNYTTVPVYNEMFLLENQYLKVLLEKLFLGLLALFFLGVGVRLLCCSKSGITTFTKLIKQVLQPLTSEIKKSDAVMLIYIGVPMGGGMQDTNCAATKCNNNKYSQKKEM